MVPATRLSILVAAKRIENNTWNNLIKHKVACRHCIHGNLKECLLGQGLSDDWITAMRILSKHLE
jgi:hypothetical protein